MAEIKNDTDREINEFQKKARLTILTPEEVKELFSNTKGAIIYNAEYYSPEEGIAVAKEACGGRNAADMHPYPGGSSGNGQILVIVF